MKSITIITVCYNAEKHIEECLKSVASQTYPKLEYIVIDGDSTDNTLNIIKKYDDKIDKWISEKDSGISEAMNKGLKMARGDYILFLHSDDYLLSNDSVENAVKRMDGCADIYAFSVLLGNKQYFTKKRSTPFSCRIRFKTTLMHQGTFCRKRLFDSVGNFDESLKIAMDYDFFLRAFYLNATLVCQKSPLTFMKDTGVSSKADRNSLKERFAEEKKIHFKNAESRGMCLLYKFYWLLYPIYRGIRHYFLHTS